MVERQTTWKRPAWSAATNGTPGFESALAVSRTRAPSASPASFRVSRKRGARRAADDDCDHATWPARDLHRGDGLRVVAREHLGPAGSAAHERAVLVAVREHRLAALVEDDRAVVRRESTRAGWPRSAARPASSEDGSSAARMSGFPCINQIPAGPLATSATRPFDGLTAGPPS